MANLILLIIMAGGEDDEGPDCDDYGEESGP